MDAGGSDGGISFIRLGTPLGRTFYNSIVAETAESSGRVKCIEKDSLVLDAMEIIKGREWRPAKTSVKRRGVECWIMGHTRAHIHNQLPRHRQHFRAVGYLFITMYSSEQINDNIHRLTKIRLVRLL